MKIFDITQEMLNGEVYVGDTAPAVTQVMRMAGGDICNLSDLNFCVHNGTHIDAPYHFIENGKSIDEVELSRCFGEATVIEVNGEVSADIIIPFLKKSKKRLLIKGDCEITLEAAEEIVKADILLIGVENQTVGPPDSPREVHEKLLGAEIVVLEGVVLSNVDCGEYFLSALPLKLGGLDGAPCRAVLVRH
jgi:arylformamidase